MKFERLKHSSKSSQRHYEQQKYWNDRYIAKLQGKSIDEDDDHTDEWYFSYSDISDVLKSYIKSYHRCMPVLDIGCGLSQIFSELLNDHFIGPFYGIDYSPIVIEQCKQLSKDQGCFYLCLDMMHTKTPSFPVNGFGLIIDKATTDGILNNSRNLSTISIRYERASNFLLSNGLFIIITIKTVDDKEWFEDCLIPSLIRGSQNQEAKFIIHFHRCMEYTDGTDNGPNIFVVVKYNCKTYSLRSSTNRTPQDISQLVTIKCY